MICRRRAVAAALVLTALPVLAAGKDGPKPLDPLRSLKLHDDQGYFDDVFGLDDDGGRIALLRGDGATFAKLEIVDAATGATTASFDLPNKLLVPVRIDLLPRGSGVVLIARELPDDRAPVYAFHFDDAGRVTAKVGPATAFGRPPADGGARAKLLVGFDRKPGAHGAEATYTIAAFELATLAPAGKPRVYKTDAAGELKAPPARLIGFYDGYSRALCEVAGAYDKSQDVRKPPRQAVLDTATGKLISEGEIADVAGWAVTTALRRDQPGRSLFVELNQDATGVDVVDAMGKKQPVALAAPFKLYDPKSLLSEEGPAPCAVTFGIAIDPLNPDAVARRKPDLPMLDLYAGDAAKSDVKLRGRVFIPRPVVWQARGDRLVVLKRFKSFARGGDELQIFSLR